MSDKYKNIRDIEEIKMTKIIVELNRKQRIRERFLVVLLIIAFIFLLYVLFFHKFDTVIKVE